MSDRRSMSSFNSKNYLKVVTEKVMKEKKNTPQDDDEAGVSSTCSMTLKTKGKFTYCDCSACRERQKMAINRNTVYQMEFELHNLDPDDRNFLAELTEQCRRANVCGYIIYGYGRENASGAWEGAIKDMNRIKDWLLEQKDYIPEPMEKNIYFSLFMISRQPMKLLFDEHSTLPQLKDAFSGGSSSD